MGHHVNRKEYWVIFVALAVLTALEVGLTEIPIGRGLMATGLIGLAVVKAALVALFYMHLNHETKILRWSIAIPMAVPPFYAVILMMDAAWRMMAEW